MDGFRWSPFDAPQGILQAPQAYGSSGPQGMTAAAVKGRGGASSCGGSGSGGGDGGGVEGRRGGGASAGDQGGVQVVPCPGALRSNELSEAELAGALPAVQQVSSVSVVSSSVVCEQ